MWCLTVRGSGCGDDESSLAAGADRRDAEIAQQAEWLERSYPQAAARLGEGMESASGGFTINCLGLSPMLCKCLATTNVIESSLSGVEGRTGRVTCWRSGKMALRWAPAAALETEKNFRKIPGRAGIGFRDLWMWPGLRPPPRPFGLRG